MKTLASVALSLRSEYEPMHRMFSKWPAFLLALCLATPGCATYSLADAAPPGFARLGFVPAGGEAPRRNYDGLWAIGTTPFDPPGRDAVWVRPGKRAVGYVCPGVIFMDWPPTITHTFEPGGRYELVCDRGQGSIRPLP